MPETQADFDRTPERGTPRTAKSGAGGRNASSGTNEARAPKRCVANPLLIDRTLNVLLDGSGFGDTPHDEPVRLALKRVARRAVMEEAGAFRLTKVRRDGDGPHVADRLKEGGEVWRFRSVPDDLDTELRVAAMGVVAMREAIATHGDGEVEGDGEMDGNGERVPPPPSLRLAHETLAKLERLQLKGVAERAGRFERMRWKETLEARWNEPLAPAHCLVASGGRVWQRVTTLVAMKAVGERFDNCLARSGHARRYQRAMLEGSIRLYVLRDAANAKREHALVAWHAETREIEDLEAPKGEAVPGRFRDDVRQLVLRRRLRGDDRLAALGLVPGTLKGDPEPWMEGTIALPSPPGDEAKPARSARRAYRAWSFKGRVLVEVGRHDPVYTLFEARPGEPLAEQGLDDLGDATATWEDEALEAARLALVDAARHAPTLPATVARLLVLCAHEGLENERRRREREARRRLPRRQRARVA